MITIKFEFNYQGETYKPKACLKDDMTLSNSKQNDATDLIEDYRDGSRWSLCFEDFIEGYLIEIVMYRDGEGDMTTEAEYAIVWDNETGTIEDTIDVKSSTTRK